MRKTLTEEQVAFLTGLVDQYDDALLKYAIRFLHYRPDLIPVAQEAVQEMYVRAIRHVDELMAHENPVAWLKLCLKRLLLNHARSRAAQLEELTEDVSAHPEIEGAQVNAAMEAWSGRVSLQEVQEMAPVLLSPEEQRIFDEHFLYGLTTEETASLESIPAATVRGCISRIRKKLRKYFIPVCLLMLEAGYYHWR